MATRIKRYEARLEQLDELLSRIEREMGPNAELETREFRRQRFLGLFGGQRMVEVIAILDVGGTRRQSTTSAKPRVRPTAASTSSPPTPEPAPVSTPQQQQVAAHPPQAAPQAARPPAGPATAPPTRPRRFDVTADEPTQLSIDPPVGTAEARIAADAAQFTRQSAAIEELEQRQREQFEARLARTAQESRPEAPPRSTISAMEPPAKDSQPAQPQDDPAAEGQDAATAGSDISELRDTIAELTETVKLIAASRPQDSDTPSETAAQPAVEPQPPEVAAATADQPATAPAQPPAAETAPAPEPAAEPLRQTVPEAQLVADPIALDHGKELPELQRRVYDRLLDWNIGPYDALELLNLALDQLPDAPSATEEQLQQAIFREICRSILLCDGIQLGQAPPGKAVALVGATGVGKTTTIAKLAAQFAFQQGRRVSLVSLDNYRIAAAEQLRTYADIMGLDLDIVFSREEFDQVLTQRRSSDLILIDTAGRSPLNSKQVYELREIFAGHPPDEVHLVVTASTKADDVRLLLESFEPLSYDHVIVSKLDETRSLGCLYNLIKCCQLPISYFTVGQSVPEDLRTANLEFVRAWIEQGRIS